MKEHLRALLIAAGAALASVALLAPAAQATPPAPPYEDFAGCPSPEERLGIAFCFKLEFDGGHLELGKRNIPVTNPIVLRGAATQLGADYAANSEGGIVPVKQTVEGGLVGLTGIDWLDEVLSQEERLKVYATVELAGEPGSLEADPYMLPVKVHLENPLLGGSCYVGSEEDPIQLALTPGTTSPPAPNEPISGKLPSEFEPEAERPEVEVAADGVFVDNSYAVPAANGCKLKLGPYQLPIDDLVNRTVGLPAAAGTNEAVLDLDLSIVFPEVVYP